MGVRVVRPLRAAESKGQKMGGKTNILNGKISSLKRLYVV